MQITRFTAQNYKSIRLLEKVELTSGFNVVTGQNAAGKTALLELLGFDFTPRPHRTLKTVRKRGDATHPESTIDVCLKIPNDELTRALRNPPQRRSIALPQLSSRIPNELQISVWHKHSITKFLEWLLTRPHYDIELCFVNGNPIQPSNERSAFGLYPIQTQDSDPDIILRAQFVVELDGRLSNVTASFWDGTRQLPADGMLGTIAHLFGNFVYRFSSERTVRARHPHGTNTQLSPTGTNLAEVLNILQGNRKLFENYAALVSEVLPQVKWISIGAVRDGHEILVWNHDWRTTREDLAVPLDQTDSGVAQVLAILYVIVTSHEEKTIIIDEPQSFLHPASAVKLIEILKRYDQHQFILATHSPSIIAAARPKNILALRYEDEETKLEIFDLHRGSSFNNFLNSAGLHLQDVFGADNILWVEGPTEHRIFPEILERLVNIQLMGTTIAPVQATGDLEGRDAERVFEMYRTLTRGNAILSPVLSFILDRETRTEQACKEMFNLSDNRAIFLKRRMFENYLLNPDAVAGVMNSIDGFRTMQVTAEEVTMQFERKRSEKKYFHPIAVQQDWISTINASKVLADIFGELSERRVEYRKPDHSVQIAKWILENSPQELNEVAEVLREAFGRRATAAHVQ